MRDRELNRSFVRFREHGDVRALGRLFDQVAPELYHIATNLVPGPADADDLVQETFLTAIERAATYDASRNVVPWMFGILVKHARELRRGERRSLDPERLQRDPEPAPEVGVQQAELSSALEDALEGLPGHEQTVMRSFLQEGKRAVAIATEMGLAPGTVRMRIHRGLEQVRRKLGAGHQLGALVALPVGLGRDGVREIVLERAQRYAIEIGVALTPAATPGIVIGGIAVTKKLITAVAAGLVLAAGSTWLLVADQIRANPTAPHSVAEFGASISAPEAAPASPDMDAPALLVEKRAPSSEGVRTALAAANRTGLARFSGRLLEHDGEPSPHLAVALVEVPHTPPFAWLSALRSGPLHLDLVIDRTTTDAEGRFHLEGAQAHAVQLLVVDAGGPRASIQLLDEAVVPGAEHDLGDVLLSPTARVSGRVLDESGSPLGGARVRLTHAPPELGHLLSQLRTDSALLLPPDPHLVRLPRWAQRLVELLPVPTTRTDAEGRFCFEAASVDSATLIADAPGYALASRAIGIDPGSTVEAGSIALSPGRRIAGFVRGANQAPISGAEVFVGTRAIGSDFRLATKLAILRPAGVSGPDGSFAASGLEPDGELVVVVRHEGASAVQSRPDEAPFEFELPARGSLRLIPTASEPKLRSLLLYPSRDPGPLKSFLTYERWPLGSPRQDGSYLVAAIPYGPYSGYVVSERGHALPVEVQLDREAVELELAFPPVRNIVIRVQDSAGEPLPEAQVLLLPAQEREALMLQATDVEGVTVLNQVPFPDAATEYRLQIEHPAYPPHQRRVDSSAEEFVVQLDHGGRAEFRIFDEAGQARGIFAIRTQHEDELFGLSDFAHTDPEGILRLTDLALGEHEYKVYRRPESRDVLRMISGEVDPPLLAWGNFQVHAEGTTTVEVQLEPRDEEGKRLVARAAFTGQLSLGGVPTPGLQVRVQGLSPDVPFGPQTTETGTAGEFAFDDVPATLLALDVRQADGRRIRREVLSVPNTGLHLTRDWPRSEVEVTVRNAAGFEAADTTVRVFPREPRAFEPRWGRTDRAGRARIEVHGDGGARVFAHHDRFGTGFGELELAPNGQLSLEVALDPGVPCAGVARMMGERSGTERVFMRVQLAPPEEGRLGTDLDLYLDFEDGEATFEIAGLKPGSFPVFLWTDSEERADGTLVVPPRGGRQILLEFGEFGAYRR